MQTAGSADAADAHPPPGVVELREDIPLKAGAGAGAGAAGEGGGGCARGPRLILLAFAALSAAITLALLTQIYYGDFEVVPHGAVSSAAAACSGAGTDALKAGGRALDAALAAQLCLAALAPHRTSLDASGALLYWEYRQSRTQQPSLVEWGGVESQAVDGDEERPPRLLAALAALHARLGSLPWSRLLQPAIDLARDGFPVSEGLARLEGSQPGTLRTAPAFAALLQRLQLKTSQELSAEWNASALVREGEARALAAGGWRAWTGGAGARQALAALAAALQPHPASADEAESRVVGALQAAAADPAGLWPPAGVSSGLAVVDRFDNYIALVTGLSMPFGNGPVAAGPAGEGWTRDSPTTPLDLAPAILADGHICGTRYVIGAESSGALAQAAAALVTGGDGSGGASGAGSAGGAAEGVERARVEVQRGGALAYEARPLAPADAGAPPAPPAPPAVNATLPYPAVNVVQQRADALLSHADSRSGGVASRF